MQRITRIDIVKLSSATFGKIFTLFTNIPDTIYTGYAKI